MLALATPNRPVYIPVTDYHVPTKAELRDRQVAELRAIAERIGFRWGGIERGDVLTLHIGDGEVKRQGWRAITRLLNCWAQRFDAGDLDWYDWVYAVASHDEAEWTRVYLQRKIARGAELNQADINHLSWLTRTGAWPA